ncbi:MAG: hypothetical protein Q7T33_02495 [Dehalococcoidia bacterium]|nr:hypothetical protein [Dehalococcoidia bacterium]
MSFPYTFPIIWTRGDPRTGQRYRGPLNVGVYLTDAFATKVEDITGQIVALSWETQLTGKYTLARIDLAVPLGKAWEWAKRRADYGIRIREGLTVLWEGAVLDRTLTTGGVELLCQLDAGSTFAASTALDWRVKRADLLDGSRIVTLHSGVATAMAEALTIRGRVYTAYGAEAPAWRVRAGHLVRIDDLAPDTALMGAAPTIDELRTLTAKQTRYDALSDTLTVTPNDESMDIVQQLRRNNIN